MATETTWEGIPVYPNATEVDSRTVSLSGGGGGVESDYTSDDPYEKVVEFYEHRFGPGDTDALPGKCRWLFSATEGDWESGRMVVVEPCPPSARTRIYIGRRYWLKNKAEEPMI